MNKPAQLLELDVGNMPSSIKNFLEKFYNLLDGESSGGGKEWSEMFEANGKFIAAGEIQEGRKGTRNATLPSSDSIGEALN